MTDDPANGNTRRHGTGSAARFAPILLGAGLAGAAVLLAVRAARQHPVSPDEVTYPPRDQPKQVAEGIWIVDSGPIVVACLSLPVRMTIIRLGDGDLLLHSPVRFSPDLARRIEALGTIRHLIAPNVAHWTFLSDWQRAFPDATVWAVPGLRDRKEVRESGLVVDRDLGPAPPDAWQGEIDQGIVAGAGGFREAWFFHRASSTLVLVDLIENVEPAKLPPLTRWAMRLTGATRDSTAFHVRSLLLLERKAARQAVAAMVATAPSRVIFAHGRFFADDGAARLSRAFAWLVDD
ncbi:DUF4336 domain-containing protein [Sphingosinicella sp. BN140058]|uniref:DUF4336 domain-containing protein n=1 Tax=Sphingosinicella sp. BN140058 TaxID=1892855 RepID=UPI001013AFB9|nr:DUF4336 domain-containing protein [Sphingosinicella sp. BN140058]QAY77243.1 DUF4336 domain-containing protein [Sphingosinicella sp. BN140058]